MGSVVDRAVVGGAPLEPGPFKLGGPALEAILSCAYVWLRVWEAVILDVELRRVTATTPSEAREGWWRV